MKEIVTLQNKQVQLLNHLKLTENSSYRLKVNENLSPIGWHIMHCLYIECVWIRSYFYADTELVNKLKKVADSLYIKTKFRGINLPSFDDIYSLAKNEFTKNINFIKKLNNRKEKKLIYFLQFLINHHSQHIETIKIILNLINIKNNKIIKNNYSVIEPKKFKFMPISIKENFFTIGTNQTYKFSYDNEKPQNTIKIKSFFIDKKLIQINEWMGFILSGGYKNEKLWSKHGWNWKSINKIFYPLGWLVEGNKLSVSTPYGFKKPKKSNPVINISYYELEAFANWVKLKIPHEYEWEISYKKISDKFKAWQWCSNNFFPYNGFFSFPYKEYSEPWFNKNYITLRGSSLYSNKEIKRKTFRNFYSPNSRYIFSGGRLSQN